LEPSFSSFQGFVKNNLNGSFENVSQAMACSSFSYRQAIRETALQYSFNIGPAHQATERL
jgi:hypothetical protein